jgi:hypothetical protein
MKLFDYKFLILLGLTLVVYFMFREIIDLRKKINKLEDTVDNINNKSISDKPTKVLSNSSKEKQNFQIPLPKTNNEKPIFQIPLPQTNNEEIILQIPLPTINEENRVYELETEMEDETTPCEHLAIYSNDNEEDIIENYSIDNSSEIETPDNINNKTLLNVSDNSCEYVIKNDSNHSTEIDVPETLNFESYNIENISVEPVKQTVNDLMKHKLNELQCIAESLNIELNCNGKKKTKNDLSKEIINIYNTE